MRFKISLLVIACILLGFSQTTTYEGKVVKVLDGDTIDLLVGEGTGVRTIRIRFNGIDAPEKSQDFGAKAKDFTSSLIAGKTVTVRVRDTDRYGRSIGDVYLNSKLINLEIVKAGYAWHYKKYSSDKELAAAEDKARASKLGLWAHANPVAPWDFRHKGK